MLSVQTKGPWNARKAVSIAIVTGLIDLLKVFIYLSISVEMLCNCIYLCN